MGRIAAWLFGVPVALMVVVYLVLLIHPIPLPFIAAQVRNVVVASMPPGSGLELGDMALALEGYAWPVLQFSPVTFTDTKSGAQVRMDALEVGFSPIRAFIGQPGATVTMVGPHIQINQDLFGPRLSRFEIVPDANGGPSTVRVLEGADAFPSVGFSKEGIDVRGTVPDGPAGPGARMRSDNDWLIYNLEAAQAGIAGIIEQATMGRFSRLIIRKGTLDMNDALYGLFRTFNDITLDIAPTPDGKTAEGLFSADFGGTVMKGILERVIDGKGDARLKASINNLDLASFLPFINDPTATGSLVGATAVSIDVGFDSKTGKILNGMFHIDLTGTDLRLDKDFFPIASSIMEVDWEPKTGQFTMGETEFTIGQSSGKMSGVFVLGLDELYGPTVAMSMIGTDVLIHPNDMDAPAAGYDKVVFKGWSAPLYGAMGIDEAVLTKPGVRIESKGRIDMVRKGMGVDMTVTGQGISADDLKRLWPYFVGGDARDWFVKNVTAGVIDTSTMKFAFPVGTLAKKGEDKPIPQNGVFVEMVASGVTVIPTEGMAPITIQGKTRMQVHDSEITMAGDGATIPTDAGQIAIANAALVMTSDTPGEQIVNISGDASAGIPSIVSLIKQFQPEALQSKDLPIDVASLAGNVSVGLVATVILDKAGQTKNMDYTVNGSVQDFGSTTPIQAHTINNGQLSFMASQAGYRIGGQAEVDGMAANVLIEGKVDPGAPPPAMTLSSTVNVADLAKMGFDASQFATGKVGFVARPAADGSILMAIDLTDAALNIKDLGISKDAGVPGKLQASIKQDGTIAEISQIDLSFGDVALKGSLEFDSKKGLQSAEFSSFALSPGDQAQLSLTPIKDGFQVRLRGDQLDLKPMLKRFFDLGGGSTGGPQATAFTQTIAIDAQLKRALGFYKTTAFNLDLNLALKGTDILKANLQAQLGGDKSVSLTTNPTPGGKTLSLAFNDMGTLLRLLNIYPRVEGGEGSLLLQMDTAQKVDTGEFNLRNFALVDEANVAQILGNHQESRQLIAKQNKIAFSSGRVDFIRRSDRVEVTEGVLTGNEVGGTMQGYIYTTSRSFDLTGTYVPMFGLNSAFQKLFGPLGGRKNTGLFGITFAVRGPLDKPDFQVNPISALVPGAFRSLFEYRAKEQPRTDGTN